MNRSGASSKIKYKDGFYSGLSREKLINELELTEKIISSNKTSQELKFLYKRKYLKLLETLKEKLEDISNKNFNEGTF